ncbi:tyrosine-type recombinase/integrase [Desulfopila sp. IMCC35008]|uniref:tyrosine-type recombinase/integrase n=1 Tax=Desulfopila sp. IMCC35008 TaxID=2653858 RepID=UPI0013D144D8|nr:tyrosine-type recombinase/integrase [Desulfopila sp. IMCC35008]
MKKLHDYLAGYLELRSALGYKLRTHRSSLKNFVQFASEKEATTITTQLALEWEMTPDDANPKWWAYKLRMVHHFALYVQVRDPATEVPPLSLLPYSQKRPTPYIYTDNEISRLIAATKALPCRKGLRGSTYSTLFGLIWVTGLRISEALFLNKEDVNHDNQLLTIRNAKFGKSRLIPIRVSTANALAHYAHCRDQIFPDNRSPSFFLSTIGTRPTTAVAQLTFKQICSEIGIRDTNHGKRPRIHDMRHSFAVKSLVDIYKRGNDVEQEVYSLSVYMGHVGPSSTYWYFSAVPELLELARDRLESKRGNL